MSHSEFPLSIDEINAMSGETFVSLFGDVAEHSPWVAQEAARLRPYAGRKAMVAAFAQAMQQADNDRQLALVRAHPDLAGKAARSGQLAQDSSREQTGAGLDSLSDEEFERFTLLNNAYRERFGFPFIFAVKGADKHMILESFQARVANNQETEFQTALTQISRIFRFRIEERVQDGKEQDERR